MNQKGQTTYSGGIYSIDRWRSWNPVEVTTVNDGYITTTAQFAQIIEPKLANKFDGQALTLSVLTLEGELITSSRVINLVTSSVVLSANFASGGNAILWYDAQKSMSFQVNTAVPLNLVAAKLEIGSSQTLAHKESNGWVLNEIPDYGEQLARCQRYQELIGYEGRPQIFGSAYILDITIPYKVQKAKRPTFTVTNLSRTVTGSASYYDGTGWKDVKTTVNIPDPSQGMAGTWGVRVYTESIKSSCPIAFYLLADANV